MAFKLTEVLAVVSVDPKDGDEGIVGVKVGGEYMPAIMGDMERFKSLFPRIKAELEESGVEYRIIRLSFREDVTEELKNTTNG